MIWRIFVKKKVRMLDKTVRSSFYSILSVLGLLLSFLLIVIEVPDKCKFSVGIILFILVVILYMIIWIYANYRTNITVYINNSRINIKVGDIFEQNDYKVIAFNEYFDTLVDEKIIASSTLNGVYINEKVSDIKKLDNHIKQACKNKTSELNQSRPKGKKTKYKLGSIVKNEDYLITAFSKFDSDNRAYLEIKDYINFLQNFWNEVDIVYAGKSVSIPLLGSGITRFKDHDLITDQELIELVLWTFKISKIKFKYPSEVNIIIHESIMDKINFNKLKEFNNGL